MADLTETAEVTDWPRWRVLNRAVDRSTRLVTGKVMLAALVAAVGAIMGQVLGGVAGAAIGVAVTFVAGWTLAFLLYLWSYLTRGDPLWSPGHGVGDHHLSVSLHSEHDPPMSLVDHFVQCWVRHPGGRLTMLGTPQPDGSGGVFAWIHRGSLEDPVPTGHYEQRWYLTTGRSLWSRGRLYEVARNTFDVP